MAFWAFPGAVEGKNAEAGGREPEQIKKARWYLEKAAFHLQDSARQPRLRGT